jgi:Fe/S biogenesis protein NfuA
MLKRIEGVLDQAVRPGLRSHGGDVEVVSLDGEVLRVRLLGCCSGCPSAYVTTEELIEKAVTAAIPQISRVALVLGVSDGLMAEARAIMSARSGG